MNILFFNRSFYPDFESTGQLLTELSEDLTGYGHKVTVIAGNSRVKTKKFQLFISRDKYKLIEILRVGQTGFFKNYLFFRLINLATYFINAFLAGFLVKDKPDVVVAQTDPPVLGLLGYFFAKWYKAKFIYYCNDIYPEIGIVTGKLTNPILNLLLRQINMFSFKNADKIVCIGESMQKNIISKGIEKNKVKVVHYWADTSLLYPVDKEKNLFISSNNLKNKFIVMYSGNIGLTQNLDNVIEVARYFKEKKDLLFLFIGEGVSKSNLITLSKSYGLSNVNFLPYVSKDSLQYSLSAADIHLIPFQKGLSGVLVPSKVYGILACGKPFIAWVDKESEIYTIAHNYKCGMTVMPDDLEGMTKAIEWTINNPKELEKMGKNSRETAINYFDRKIGTAVFNKLLQEI